VRDRVIVKVNFDVQSGRYCYSWRRRGEETRKRVKARVDSVGIVFYDRMVLFHLGETMKEYLPVLKGRRRESSASSLLHCVPRCGGETFLQSV